MPKTNLAINVNNLGKQYSIGQKEAYKTISDSFNKAIKKIFLLKNFKNRRNVDFWALQGLSFEIDQGTVFGIIGRNGAGKSTLLKILSRVTFPTTGTIKINGKVGSLLEIGTGFHPELTGRENIFLSGSILGMKRNEINHDFDNIVKFSEIEKFLDTPVKRYSSGMYVRLAFAVAAFLSADILLVDEVLAVGDSQFQKKCLGKMKNISKNEGRTVLFVSHNMGAISSLCQEGILLNSGRLDAIGPISEVIDKYIITKGIGNGEIIWTNNKKPGDNVVQLNGVRITLNGNVANNIPINCDFNIVVYYRNNAENSKINISIQIFDKNGYPVLATGNLPSVMLNQDDEWSGSEYPIGNFSSTCIIPKYFLNDGLYSISIVALTDIAKIHIKEDEVLSFTIHDTGEMRAEFMGGWIGVVRPKLEWHTHHLNHEED